jgi:hypothetical protein
MEGDAGGTAMQVVAASNAKAARSGLKHFIGNNPS